MSANDELESLRMLQGRSAGWTHVGHGRSFAQVDAYGCATPNATVNACVRSVSLSPLRQPSNHTGRSSMRDSSCFVLAIVA